MATRPSPRASASSSTSPPAGRVKKPRTSARSVNPLLRAPVRTGARSAPALQFSTTLVDRRFPMSGRGRQRTSFGKLQRERARQEKQAAKRAKRHGIQEGGIPEG